jgi:hypothetical protein
MDRVKSGYAGAGLSGASFGDFGKTVGQGITNAIAPLAYQASNDLANRKLTAQDRLYGAGNTTGGILSGMDQQKLSNQQAGIGASNSAMLAQDSPYMRTLDLQGMQRNLPVQNIAQLENLIVPMAGLGRAGIVPTPTARPTRTRAYLSRRRAGRTSALACLVRPAPMRTGQRVAAACSADGEVAGNGRTSRLPLWWQSRRLAWRSL